MLKKKIFMKIIKTTLKKIHCISRQNGLLCLKSRYVQFKTPERTQTGVITYEH